MPKTQDTGVSASFIDLLCCALGGIILLVVLFSVKLKPGNAVESSSFVIVEFTLLLDVEPESLGQAIEALSKYGLAVSFEGDRTPDITYSPSPAIDTNDIGSYRWLTNREKDEVHAYLVLIDPDRDLHLRAKVSNELSPEERKRVNVSFYTNRKPPKGPISIDEDCKYHVERMDP